MNRFLRRALYAGSAVFCGAMLWGASSASASGDDGSIDIGQVQEAVLGNSTTQDADASITNTQVNVNAPIAVLSDDSNNGDVSQSNEADNTAIAENDNNTDQTVHQDQAAASDDGNVDQDQAAELDNSTDQQAGADVDNDQVNVNAPIAVLSDGSNSGDVSQSNEADNTAIAVNDNDTDQTVQQDQTADAASQPAGDAAVVQDQLATIGNETGQTADASVDNQEHNINGAPYGGGGDERCGSCGGTSAGDVTQSNDADNHAEAVNDNDTDQTVHQDQTAAAVASDGHDGCGRCGADPGKPGKDDGGDATVDQQQSADLGNETYQDANAYVDNQQHNTNDAPSRGGGDKRCGCHDDSVGTGDVTQSNDADGTAIAINDNDTDQTVHQDQTAAAVASGGDEGHGYDRCGHCGGKPGKPGKDDGGDATVDQHQSATPANRTDQRANAHVGNRQDNVNEAGKAGHRGGKPHRAHKGCGCKETGKGHGAIPDVTQFNRADNTANAANDNDTDQRVRQDQTAGVVSGIRQLTR